MIVTPAIANLIREGKVAQIYSAIQTGAKLGMQTMEQALANLVKAGIITFEAAVSKSSKPEEMQRILAGAGSMGSVASKMGATATKTTR
jgi:twitching motility protein PilT